MRRSSTHLLIIMILFATVQLLVVTSEAAQTILAHGSGGGTTTGASETNIPALPEQLTRQAIRDVLSGLNDSQTRELLLRELDKMVREQEEALTDVASVSAGDTLLDLTKSLVQNWIFTLKVAVKIPEAIVTISANFKNQRGDTSLWRLPGSLLVSLLIAIATAVSVGRLMRRQKIQLDNLQPSNLWLQMGIISARFAIQGAQLTAFVLVAYSIDFFVNRNIQVDSSVVRYIIDSIGWVWFAAMLARFVLSPARPDLRLCTVDNKAARFFTWRISLIFGWSAISIGLLPWLQQFDWPFGEVRLGFWFTAIFYGLIALTICQGRTAITQMIIGQRNIGSAWCRFAEIWPTIALVLIFFQWLIVELIVATGNIQELSTTALNTFIAIIISLPLFEVIIQALVEAIWPDNPEQELPLRTTHRKTQAGLVRFFRVLAVALITVSLAKMWGLELSDLATQIASVQFAAAMMEIFLIALIAYGSWEILNIIADRQIAIERVKLGIDANYDKQQESEGGQGGTRLGTLMPLARGAGHVIIVLIATLAILDQLGVNVTPLLAGAGIVGLAVGFGAQTLVKDIFSGMFFLIDDAFRKGEYISLGTVKGTVEKISIRSMQLRHHTGSLNTVPFGEIKQLTNYSRDWVTMKLPLRLTYDTDANKVRKMIKKLGKELLDHPEIGHLFLSPLKSQGILAMEDSAMIMRIKFTTKPGDQFSVRRFVLDAIRKLFEINEIKFASREVTVRIAEHDIDHSKMTAEKNSAAAAAHSIIEQEGGKYIMPEDKQ